MNYVLDTNVVSELRKPRPNHRVLAWINGQDSAHLFIATITLGEAWQGFHALPVHHPDYDRVKAFVVDLPRQYRVLNFDARAAAIWGQITGTSKKLFPLRDSLIAAIARSRGYRVATRDVEPFARSGCKVVNPWV